MTRIDDFRQEEEDANLPCAASAYMVSGWMAQIRRKTQSEGRTSC